MFEERRKLIFYIFDLNFFLFKGISKIFEIFSK